MLIPAKEFRSFVKCVVTRFEPPHNRVNLDTLSALWVPLIVADVGRAYGNVGTDGNVAIPAGFLLGMFITDPISGEKQAVQCLWMQAPGERRGHAALALFRQFEADAKEKQCNRILSGCVVISDMPKMARLYKRLGYSCFSENFSKTL
jgi:hypothetical protein